MDDFSKYLRGISDELKILQGDITRIVTSKEKEHKEEEKKSQEKEGVTKKSAKEQFRGISLKSLQPVTKMYKSEKEIKDSQENPEFDFITKKLEDIFSK